MDVFEGRVIGVLGGDNEGAEENAVKSPLFGLNGEIRLGALDVHEGDQKVGGGNLSSLDHVRYELGELRVLVCAGDGTTSRRRGGRGTEGNVNDLSSGLNNVLCEMKVRSGKVNVMWRMDIPVRPLSIFESRS